MTQMKENTQRLIDISFTDLPLYCPGAAMTRWNAHPRVYLKLDPNGQALCPYCSTHYRLSNDTKQLPANP